MSTQHRPTFHPAVGSSNTGPVGLRSYHFSSKDQAAHTKLKYRVPGQSTKEDIRQRDLVAELERREQEFLAEKNKQISAVEIEEKAVDTSKVLLLTSGAAVGNSNKVYDDADAKGSDDGFVSSSEEDDSDEDDELELQRELEQIKRDREAAAAKKLEEERLESERIAMESAVKGNPLMNMGDTGTARVKRQWNDDVVFKNQSRGEPELKKRFVNDTIRSDFHRSFLKKYIR